MFPVGIDVSKSTLDLCMLYEGIKGRIKTRNIRNDRSATDNIIRWLRLQHCGPQDVHLVMEATGVYHERLATDLHDAGFCVSLANSHRSREFARGMGVMTKTDKVDEYMLACYALLKKPHCWEPPAPQIRHLSALLRRRDVLLGDAVREENRLEKYQSTDTPADVNCSGIRIALLLREEINGIERQIKAHIQDCPDLERDYSLLTSIKSVGPQLGMHMLVVLRSHNFESAEQAAAYLGVVPVEKRSGTLVHSRPRMSKIGPTQLRAKLYISALCGKIHNKRMRTMYDELCMRGKPKMVAIGALMRKLVHWCYGVLKTGTAFCDESYITSVYT